MSLYVSVEQTRNVWEQGTDLENLPVFTGKIENVKSA